MHVPAFAASRETAIPVVDEVKKALDLERSWLLRFQQVLLRCPVLVMWAQQFRHMKRGETRLSAWCRRRRRRRTLLHRRRRRRSLLLPSSPLLLPSLIPIPCHYESTMAVAGGLAGGLAGLPLACTAAAAAAAPERPAGLQLLADIAVGGGRDGGRRRGGGA
jgi:hypothetical protein